MQSSGKAIRHAHRDKLRRESSGRESHPILILIVGADIEERKNRMQHMRRVVRENNIYRWAGALIGELCEVRLDEAPNRLEPQSKWMPDEQSAESIGLDQSVDGFRDAGPITATGDHVGALLERGYGIGHRH